MVKLIELWWLHTCHRQTWGAGKKATVKSPTGPRAVYGQECSWQIKHLTVTHCYGVTTKMTRILKHTLTLPTSLPSPPPSLLLCQFILAVTALPWILHKYVEDRKLHRGTDIKVLSVRVIPSLFPLTDIIWLIFFHGRPLFTHPPSINSSFTHHYISLECSPLRLYPIVTRHDSMFFTLSALTHIYVWTCVCLCACARVCVLCVHVRVWVTS